MNNNTFSTSTLINDDNISSFYNDYYPSLLPHIDHHHQFLQPSPFSQFEFVPDCGVPLDSFLPQNNGHEDYNQTIPHNPPSLLPLNNTIGDQPTEPSQTITHIEDSQRISTSQDPKMKRTKKPTRTDRHSKIKTAKGIRDRRMRLSLDVAKELFGLQDMLGFDKASKTVEWLLTQAKPEIIKIATTLSQQCGFSSGDESHTRPALGSMETSSDLCEIASMWMADDRSSNTNTTETMGNKVDGRSMRRKRKKLEPRTPILKKMSKDERAKARERAKHRTIEKMEMKRRSELVGVVDGEVHGLGEILKNNNIRDVNPSSFGMTHYKELCKNNGFAVGNDFVMNKKNHIPNESYGINNKLNSSFPMINQHHSQGAPNPIEQYQFTDLDHFLGKSRDLSYNYLNMR